jgi:integrase/recombinase XerD
MLKYIQAYRHRGRWRLRFRRKGCPGRDLPVPRGYAGPGKPLPGGWPLDFLAVYQQAMAEPVAPLKPGEKRAVYGTVAWLVAEYLGSLDFLGRPKSVRQKHQMYCDRFRAKRGDLPVARVEQVHLESLLAQMIDRPATANQWLVAMRDLFKYAVKRKLLVVNPAAEIAKRSSGNPDGHHTWTPEQVAQFRRRHPIGTKARLAFELINALAFRRSDVIRVGPPDVRNGVLKYVQHKMREHTPSPVEVPMPTDLMALIRATPGTGIKTWLVDGTGKPFTEEAFSHWFADRCDEAGLPTKTRASGKVVRLCTPHGMRKRCLTDLAESGKTIHEIMSISGHLTMKEVERYTRMADRARNARAAMKGRYEQEGNTESTGSVTPLITCDTLKA